MKSKKTAKHKKALTVTVCVALILAVTIIGTAAYLTDSTKPVKNTFTVGKLLDDPLKFVLKEHEAKDEDKDGVYTLGDKEVETNAYTVLPGVDMPKDPFVRTDEALKLDAYVFIEVVDNTGTNIHFIVDTDKWVELTGKTGPEGGKVYVMKANGGIAKAGAELEPVTILTGNKLTVDNAEITDAAAQFGGDVTFYGYMIQAGGFNDYNAAWAGFSAK